MKKYINLIVAFVTIIFILPVITYAKNEDVTCSDLAKNKYTVPEAMNFSRRNAI